MLETSKAEYLHSTRKIIEETLIWKPSGQGFRLNAAVYAPEMDEDMRLVCTYGRSNIGFCLLYQNHPVRRYDNGARHKSRSTGEVFTEPHKHTWDEQWQNDKAYIPRDISPRDDVNARLLAFLQEENIQAQGGYQQLMT